MLGRIGMMLLVMAAALWSAEVHKAVWKRGETFSGYLERNGIPQSLLRTISPEDAKYLSEIQAGEKFYELKEEGRLLHTLIPIGEEMQISVAWDPKEERYRFDIIPIVYREVKDRVTVEIRRNCYSDIDRLTRNPRLGFLLKRLYKGAVDFRKLRKGDRIAFAYRQKSRLGEPWGQPKIEGAALKQGKKTRFVFVDEEGGVWHDVFKTVRQTRTGVREVTVPVTRTVKVSGPRGRFVMPIRGGHITSRFSYKRWHPTLHRYRPHLGVDWGAKRGTPLYAVAGGRVIYAGWMRGYGKVVKIDHGGGYVSLYAHQSRLKVRRGSYVKRGEVIGYVGNTGRSTAPHLHFGLYRNAKAVNPLRYINKKALSEKRIEIKKITKHRMVEIEGAKRYKQQLLNKIDSTPEAFRWHVYKQPYDHIGDRRKYEEYNQEL